MDIKKAGSNCLSALPISDFLYLKNWVNAEPNAANAAIHICTLLKWLFISDGGANLELNILLITGKEVKTVI
jgi:hypothetical protein